MAFASDEESDVDGASEDCDEEVAVAAAAADVASAEADVDCNPCAVPLFDVAVVTLAALLPPPPGCPCTIPMPCPFFARTDALCSFDRSVLVLLAAVTSAASLPTRTVQGADGDQCRMPVPVSRISKTIMVPITEKATMLTQLAEQRAAKSLRKFIGAE